MNFFKRMAARFALGTKATDFFALIDAAENQSAGMGSSYSSIVKNGYEKNGVAFRAVSNFATSLAAIPWDLFRERPGEDADEAVGEHALIDLLERPNPQQAQVRFLEELVTNMFLAGKNYVRAVNAGEGSNGLILINLRPDNVALANPSAPSAGWKLISSSTMIPREEVMFLNFLDPLNAFDGLSPLQVATLPINQAAAARTWNWNMLRRGARPPGLLKSKIAVNQDQRDKIRREFMSTVGGSDNSGVPPIVGGDLDWVATGISPGEMEWVAGTILADRLVATTLGYPSQLLGDREASTYANYQEARKALYQERIVPLLAWIIGEFNRWLVPMFDDSGELYFKENLDSVDALHEARRDEWERVGNADVLSVDEKRQAIGYEAIGGEGGGLICLRNGIVIDGTSGRAYMPATLVPTDGEVAPEPEAEPAAGATPGQGTPPPAGEEGGEEEAARKWFNLVTPQSKRAHYVEVERGRVGYERMAISMARKLFDRERRKVVTDARLAPNPDWLIHAVGTAIDAQQVEWFEYYKRVYGTVGSYFARQVARAIGKSSPVAMEEKSIVDQWMRYLAQWMSTEGAEKVSFTLKDKINGIAETTKNQIRTIVNDGVANGMGVIDIAKGIDDLYLDQIIPRRSEVIARTEVISASNHASDFSARQTGLALEKEWIATIDDRTRDSHKDAEGQRVAMDDPFQVNGFQMMFPGDSSLGAPGGEIINCRCTVGYHVVE